MGAVKRTYMGSTVRVARSTLLTKFFDPKSGEAFSILAPCQPPSSSDQRFNRGDFGALARIAFAQTAMRSLPQKRWIPLVEAVPHRRRHTARRQIEAGLAAFLGPEADRLSLTKISAAHRQASARRLMVYAADDTGNWHPSISLAGGERLERALARGNGAILWCDSFLFQTVVGKRALFQNGFQGHQVSVPEHGYSQTRLGRSTLNAFQQRVELKYARRLVFDRDDPPAAVRLILKTLEQGELVLITNNTASALQTIEMSFGHCGKLRLALGPIRIAQTCGVPILPFAIFEIEAFRRYEALVGEEIAPLGTPSPENAQLAIATAMLAYRDWLKPHLVRWPEQWMRWPSLVAGRTIEAGDD